MTNRSQDIYTIRREELELVLNELCSVIESLQLFLNEDRRTPCTIEEVNDVDF